MLYHWLLLLTDCDGVQDINQFNLRENLGWSPSQISTYQAIWGVSVLLGGVTVKSSIERLGFSGHTTLSNCALAFGFYCQVHSCVQPCATQGGRVC